MDLRQLRSFLAVVEHGSFSAAAESLFTVQSNVSTHVARLETEVGTTLLNRRTRQVTPAGQIVEERAREVLRQLDAITNDLADIENRIIGEVTCGTTPSIGIRVIPSVLARSTAELPEVAVSVVEAHSGTLVQQLLSGDIDIAITTGVSSSDLHSIPLFTEDIVAVLSSGHWLAERSMVTLDDLAETKLLLPMQDNPLYTHIDRAFAAADLPMGQSGLEVGSSALVQAMSSANVGVSLIPATAASDSTQSNTVVRPIEGLKPRAVALTLSAGSQPSRALQAVAAIVEETAREMVDSMPGCLPITTSHSRSLEPAPHQP